MLLEIWKIEYIKQVYNLTLNYVSSVKKIISFFNLDNQKFFLMILYPDFAFLEIVCYITPVNPIHCHKTIQNE